MYVHKYTFSGDYTFNLNLYIVSFAVFMNIYLPSEHKIALHIVSLNNHIQIEFVTSSLSDIKYLQLFIALQDCIMQGHEQTKGYLQYAKYFPFIGQYPNDQ